MIIWVNPAGSFCLTVGVVAGFAGAGLGMLIGPRLGLGREGYVLGLITGPLALIIADIAVRVHAYTREDGDLDDFIRPSRGGSITWTHAALYGLFWLVFGTWIFRIALSYNAEAARKQAKAELWKKESARLDAITRRLPRGGVGVEVEDRNGVQTVTLTNRTGHDLAKVTVWPRFEYSSPSPAPTSVEWAEWRKDEARTFTAKSPLPLRGFAFELHAYPAGADEPRYMVINAGAMKGGRWVENEIGQ